MPTVDVDDCASYLVSAIETKIQDYRNSRIDIVMNERPAAAAAPQTESSTVVELQQEQQHTTYAMQLNPRPHVHFDESVIDNEGLGRKKSKSKSVIVIPESYT